MKKTLYITACLACAALLFPACSNDIKEQPEEQEGVFSLTSTVEPFAGEDGTRVNFAGTDFETGDLIRMKVICPFVTAGQLRESTYGDSYDSFWLLKWTGSGWGKVTAEDGFDVDGDIYVSGAPYIIGQTMGQQTPYVFTASTWTDEVRFVEKGSQNPVICFSNVFHADQRNIIDYKASDVLWAQQFMETACWDLHLTFKHKMAALRVTIDDAANPVSDFDITTLTIEGMPDIDQQEIIIGDYYAAKSKYNSKYGYKEKNSCTVENNGKVLGVGVNNKSSHTASCKAFSAILESCVYYAYHIPGTSSKVFQIILPPVALPAGTTLWFRNDDKRFKCTITAPTAFESGTMYNVTMTLPADS